MERKCREFSEFRESDKLITEALIGFNLKIPISHMYLACAVVVSWSFTQGMVGSNPSTAIPNIFSHGIQQIQRKYFEKTQLF